MFEATDENDLEIAMVVLQEGNTYDNSDEEERSARVGTYHWDKICTIRWMLKL